MPENNFDKFILSELWTFIVIIISSGIGGCAAAFTNHSNQKKLVTVLSICGYAITGIFGALVTFTLLSTIGQGIAGDLHSVVLWSSLTGFSTSIALAGTNIGFRLVLKRLGLEFEINVKRIPKPSKNKEP